MKKIIIAILIVLLMVPAVFAQGNAPVKKEWTLMLYFVPDEKIEDNLIGNINSIAKIGSGENLNIVLMFDYASNKPTTYYYIDKTGAKKIKELAGETNMGDPQTFYDFMKFSMTNYPAERYSLIVNSHGSGWESFYGAGSLNSSAQDDSQIQINSAYARSPLDLSGAGVDVYRCIAYDDGADCLTLKEIKKSIGMAMKNFNGGKKLEVFVADACLFGMIEAAYELRDAVSVVMGSESTIPGNGLDYRAIAQEMTRNPKISAQDLSKVIAKTFTSANSGDNILVGIDTANIEPYAVAFSDLAQKLLAVKEKKSFQSVSNIGEVSKYSDIWNIMDCIISKKVSFVNDPKFTEILNQASVVKEKQKACLAAFSASGSFSKGFGGIAVYWPDKERYPKFRNLYKVLDYSKKFFWDEFLDNTLLGMTVQASASNVRDVNTNILGIVSDLDGAFSQIRRNPSAEVNLGGENESAKVEFLKKRVVEETVAQHKMGNRTAVHSVLKAVRNSSNIDTATKNKVIDELKKGVMADTK